jgi:hypothetical protein
VFKWNFPLAGTYWLAADALVQTIAKKEGGLDKLKGKKVTLVYHDSPYGKEPIPLLQERASMHGLQPAIAAGDGAWCGAEGHLAAGAPGAPRTTCCCGAGAS